MPSNNSQLEWYRWAATHGTNASSRRQFENNNQRNRENTQTERFIFTRYNDTLVGATGSQAIVENGGYFVYAGPTVYSQISNEITLIPGPTTLWQEYLVQQQSLDYPKIELTNEENTIMNYYTITDDKLTFNNFIDPKIRDMVSYTISKTVDKKALASNLDKMIAEMLKEKSGNDLKYFFNNNYGLKTKAVKDMNTIIINKDVIDILIARTRGYAVGHDDGVVVHVNGFKQCLLETQDYKTAVQYYRVISEEHIKSVLKKTAAAAFNDLKQGNISSVFLVESSNIRRLIQFAHDSLSGVKKYDIKDSYAISKLMRNTNKNDFKEQYKAFYDVYNTRNESARYTIELTLAEEQIKTISVNNINIDTLYPTFKKDCETFANIYSHNFVMDNGHIWNTGGMEKIWKQFVHIKHQLIFMGLTQREAVQRILDTTLQDRGLTIAECAITKQLVPNTFLVPVTDIKGTVIFVNAYYIQLSNRNKTRYRNNSGQWSEYHMDVTEYYLQSLQGHKFNVLDYLAPMAEAGENIKVCGEGKVYQPIPYMGVELEVERAGRCKTDITEDVFNRLGRDFAIVKHDGTLKGRDPFEIVTVPATLAMHKKRWAEFMNDTAFKSNLTSFVSGNCGMHVHISRNAFTGLHLAKFMRFINDEHNAKFIAAIAQRSGNNYAHYADYEVNELGFDANGNRMEVKKSPITHASKKINGGSHGHYDAINTSNAQTIEVRIFRGNLAKSHFYKNLEFVHALWLYTKDASMKELGYKDFLFWLFKDNTKTYNNLQQWCIASKYNVSNINIKEDSDVRLKDKAQEINKIQLVVNKKLNCIDANKLKCIGEGLYLTSTQILANI